MGKIITQAFDTKEAFIKEGLNIANNGRGYEFKINSPLESIYLAIRYGNVFINNNPDNDSISSAENKLAFNLGYFFDLGFNEIVYEDFDNCHS